MVILNKDKISNYSMHKVNHVRQDQNLKDLIQELLRTSWKHLCENNLTLNKYVNHTSLVKQIGFIKISSFLSENIIFASQKVCAFCFCLKSQSTILQSFWDGANAFWVFTSTLGTLHCLAQGHYTAVLGFEPWTS